MFLYGVTPTQTLAHESRCIYMTALSVASTSRSGSFKASLITTSRHVRQRVKPHGAGHPAYEHAAGVDLADTTSAQVGAAEVGGLGITKATIGKCIAFTHHFGTAMNNSERDHAALPAMSHTSQLLHMCLESADTILVTYCNRHCKTFKH